MKIQSINNNDNKNPNFGLKIKNNVAAGIIEQYKQFGAKDMEIAYYLRTLKKSAPDEFTLTQNNNVFSFGNYIEGCTRKICSSMRIEDNSGKYVDVVHSSVYAHNDPAHPKMRESFNYNAENKVFFIENLLNTVKKAIPMFSSGKTTPQEETAEIADNVDITPYKKIIDMSEMWPKIPYTME